VRRRPCLLVLAGLLAFARLSRAQESSGSSPDPWLKADAILGSDGMDAALAFAAPLRGADADGLREYLKRAPPVESDARTALTEAQTLLRAGELRAALEALQDIEVPEETILRARVCRLQAFVHARLGEPDDVLLALRQWRATATRLDWLRGQTDALVWEGQVLQRLLRYEELVGTYDRLAQLRTRLGEPRQAQAALVDKAGALVELDRVREALAMLPDVLDAAARNGWHEIEATAHEGTAMALWKRADYADALHHVECAKALWQEVRSTEGQVNSAMLAGTLLQELGDFDGAEAAFRAVSTWIGDGQTSYHADLKGNLGIVAWRRGNHAAALELLQEALEIYVSLGDRVRAATACRDIGEVLASQGKPAEAVDYFDRALEGFSADPIQRAETLAGKAQALVLAGDLDGATAAVERALGTDGGEQDRRTRNRLFEVQGRILLARDRPADAVEPLRKALDLIEDVVSGLSDEQTFSAREQRARVFRVALESAVRAGRLPDAIEFLERGRGAVLREAIGSRKSLRQTALPAELAEQLDEAEDDVVLARKKLLRVLTGTRKQAVVDARNELHEAEERLRSVANHAELEHRRLARVTATKPHSMREIQAAVRPGEVLVYYSLLGPEAYAFLLARGTARVENLEQGERIPDLCEQVRASLGTKGAADITQARRLLEELETVLVQPLRLDPKVRRVIVCPDGALSYLPWPELLEERFGACVPSGSTLVLMREADRARSRGILAFGAPDYSAASHAEPGDAAQRGLRLKPLLHAREEVEEITREPEGERLNRVFLGKEATEGAFKAALSKRPGWHAVHFACHGIVDHRFPRRSALALAADEHNDGFLTLPEIATLEVAADLVVLSACDTGQGRFVRGEGVVGLTRAFMIAGASRVLVSMWKVDDAATKELMVRFYRAWQGRGLSPAEALREAQREVASEPQWKHPYFWAAWDLWGLPD